MHSKLSAPPARRPWGVLNYQTINGGWRTPAEIESTYATPTVDLIRVMPA